MTLISGFIAVCRSCNRRSCNYWCDCRLRLFCLHERHPTQKEEMPRTRGYGRMGVLWLLGMVCLTPASVSARINSYNKPAGGEVREQDPVWDIRHVLPDLNLENNTFTDVTFNVGDVAYLPCRFPQLSTLHQVSWIRRWDWHILTTGIYTYTKDMRFRVLHPEGSDDWTLQLKYVETKDNGTYECQMYTGTGVLSQFVNLHVNKPRALILGPQELHVQEGDTITLVCVIQQGQPPFVFWYQEDKMVNYDDTRHCLNVITKVEGSRTHSRLTITDARQTDSGNYSCVAPNVDPSFVLVFVSEAGDTVAAVQRRGHTSTAPASLLPSIDLVFSGAIFVFVKVFAQILPVR
ncbi:zwei Ig domain protein zig-8-like isoform X3 [Penaeus japonicus]|uniref:zwei Ig domain protein zig-8-like isoform X3 n=1 Tax=Penaeus japonicus TaxID=27405 RepID=UPI001C717472|nr:zwei Ig domain protein zig-8-like isoform X3 [Penaeus japonicus]